MHDDAYEHHGEIPDSAVAGTLVERDKIFSPLHCKASQRQSLLTPKIGDCSGHIQKKSSIHSQACRTVAFPFCLTYSSDTAMPDAVAFQQPVTFCSQLSSARHFGEGLGRQSSTKLHVQFKEVGLVTSDTSNIPLQERPRSSRMKLKKPEVQQTGGMEVEALPAGSSGA